MPLRVWLVLVCEPDELGVKRARSIWIDIGRSVIPLEAPKLTVQYVRELWAP